MSARLEKNVPVRADTRPAPTEKKAGDYMKYDPDSHHRKTIRLKDYDYSSNGYYFITICTENRKCIFGKIENGVLLLNHAGKMIEKVLMNIENTSIKINKYIIMPNHIHFILQLVGAGLVSARLEKNVPISAGLVSARLGKNVLVRADTRPAPTITIGDIICSFKSKTTQQYINSVKEGIYMPFNRRIWQRNYYEHIIRGEDDYLSICQYIESNPLTWQDDEHYI